MFIRFDRVHESDRQMDGQTLRDGIGRAYPQHRAAKINDYSTLCLKKRTAMINMS